VSDTSWAERDDWESAWQPVIDAIGEDFGGGAVQLAVDTIERSAVHRYLEPLEFDCPLHYDEEVAKAHGYPGVIAPYSGLATWISAGVWSPGDDPVYTSAERNAQPARRPAAVGEGRPLPAPPTTAGFATDVEYEYVMPFVVGDHMTQRGRKLLSCLPKETSVGRGAFTIFESEVRNQNDEVVALARLGVYSYVPHQE
jgi:hypothetical protein